MAQPLHPVLADLRASGSIQLADDGSYRITGGEIDSIGQKMRLDASYTPGTRPFVMARIAAGTLDYSDFQPAATNPADEAGDVASVSGGSPDLSALRNIDADIELRADALQAGDAIARDVVIGVKLQNGQLATSVRSGQIAGGNLTATLLMDVNVEPPQSSGSLNLASIDIESLMSLAGQAAPATGRLSSQLQYAFRGADVETIRNSVNLRGDISVAEGRIDVPQLEGIAGRGASVVAGLNATAQIEDVRQPLSLSGTAQWNGEAVNFVTSLALSDLLWGQTGEVVVDFKSQPVNANFSGTISPDG
ncbi:MAG TPA: AsmA family protein, partial [Devosia sp.]|nr:AsmA family protein [Devosia sp.]